MTFHQNLSFLILFFVVTCSAGPFFGLTGSRKNKWDGLRVTWKTNMSDPYVFARLPRTASDAEKEDFVKISDCDVNAKWRGARYAQNDDMSVILLFDVNGYIAGLQYVIQWNSSVDSDMSTIVDQYLTKDGDDYILSVYFVDPAIICTSGRDDRQFNRQGTGTDLFIQTGDAPEADSVKAPGQEEDLVFTKWTKGRCYRTMGQHYWYDISKGMSCGDFYPVFLLYDKGQLTGLGWAFGTYIESRRIEHPPVYALGLFMDTVPDCLNSMGELSALHIYLTDNVAGIGC